MIEFKYLDLFNKLRDEGFVCVNCDEETLSEKEADYMNKKEIVFVPKNSLTPSVLANYILRNADEFSYPNNYFLGFKYDDEIYIFSVVQKPYGEKE